MLLFNVWILLFSVRGYLANQVNIQVASHDVTGRFGFGILDSFRKMFCHSFCNPIDGNPYIVNLSCAIKCPELYLPNHTTPSSSEKPTSALPASGTSEGPPAVSTGKPGTEKPTGESRKPENAGTEKPTAESKKPESAGSEMPSAGGTTAAPSGGMTNAGSGMTAAAETAGTTTPARGMSSTTPTTTTTTKKM